MKSQLSTTKPEAEHETAKISNQKGDPINDKELSIEVLPGLLVPPPESKHPKGDISQRHANADDEPPYTVFSEPFKVIIILTSSFAAIISPISGSIYFPALDALAEDLHVSLSAITLTITTYLVSEIKFNLT